MDIFFSFMERLSSLGSLSVIGKSISIFFFVYSVLFQRFYTVVRYNLVVDARPSHFFLLLTVGFW